MPPPTQRAARSSMARDFSPFPPATIGRRWSEPMTPNKPADCLRRSSKPGGELLEPVGGELGETEEQGFASDQKADGRADQHVRKEMGGEHCAGQRKSSRSDKPQRR